MNLTYATQPNFYAEARCNKKPGQYICKQFYFNYCSNYRSADNSLCSFSECFADRGTLRRTRVRFGDLIIKHEYAWFSRRGTAQLESNLIIGHFGASRLIAIIRVRVNCVRTRPRPLRGVTKSASRCAAHVSA